MRRRGKHAAAAVAGRILPALLAMLSTGEVFNPGDWNHTGMPEEQTNKRVLSSAKKEANLLVSPGVVPAGSVSPDNSARQLLCRGSRNSRVLWNGCSAAPISLPWASPDPRRCFLRTPPESDCTRSVRAREHLSCPDTVNDITFPVGQSMIPSLKTPKGPASSLH